MKSKQKEKSSTSAAEAWLAYARDDATAAKSLVSEDLWNLVCFHAQQATEKVLKAFLRARTGDVPKVHSLAKLIELCAKIDRTFMRHKSTALLLDRYYIPVRYPESAPGILPEGLPEKKDALQAIRQMQRVIQVVSKRLKDPSKMPLGF
jgi:HEPN domain-containing protein